MMIEQKKWVSTLRTACAKSSQRKVAKKMGVSHAVVNQVLMNTYKGDMKKIESLVRSHYLGDTVSCPVLGELEIHKCLDNQTKPFAATNPTRIALFRACRECVNNKSRQTEDVT